MITLYNIPKGVARRIYCLPSQSGSMSSPFPFNSTVLLLATKKIAKDSGGFTSLTNAPVFVEQGLFYIDLTADEMNADMIVLNFMYASSSGGNSTYYIFTAPSSSTTAPSASSSFAEKMVALYEYFFNKRTCTASALSVYKADDATVLTSGTISDDGTTVTKGKLS